MANHHYACGDTLASFSTPPTCLAGVWTFAGGESIVDQNVNFNAAANTTYYVSFKYAGTGQLCVGVGNNAGAGFAYVSGNVTDLALTKGSSTANSISLDNRGGGASKCGGNPNFVGTITDLFISDTPGQYVAAVFARSLLALI